MFGHGDGCRDATTTPDGRKDSKVLFSYTFGLAYTR